jgi:hypothetical protein
MKEQRNNPSTKTQQEGSSMSTKLRQLVKSVAPIAISFAVLGSSTTAFADDGGGPGNSPEGSWLYTVTVPGCPICTFQGIETYSEGGGYTEADQLSFLPYPGPVASAGHGAWQRIGKNKFLLTYLNLTFDSFSTGNPRGTLKVRQTTTIDRTGNSYSGSGDYTYYDLNGAPIPSISGTFTITATRILVQAPAK